MPWQETMVNLPVFLIGCACLVWGSTALLRMKKWTQIEFKDQGLEGKILNWTVENGRPVLLIEKCDDHQVISVKIQDEKEKEAIGNLVFIQRSDQGEFEIDEKREQAYKIDQQIHQVVLRPAMVLSAVGLFLMGKGWGLF